MKPALFDAVYERPWNIEGGAWRSIHAALNSGQNLDLSDFFRGRPEANIDENGVGHVYVSGVLGRHAPIAGILGDTDYGDFENELAEMETEARGVMLHLDSPGGQATGNIEAANAFADLDLPTLAFCDGMMCSAAYAIGVGADEIIATPSSLVGSIGTIIPFIDQSKLWDNVGIAADYITSGDLKGAGFPPSLNEKQRAHMQEIVDDLFSEFKGHVLRFRDVEDDYMRGQAFVAGRALGANLIDATGTYEQAYGAFLQRLR